jgi:hypothetical protein
MDFGGALVHATKRIVVVEGAEYDPSHRTRTPPLITEGDVASVGVLTRALVELPAQFEWMDWMQWPSLTFAFLADGRSLLATASYLPPDAVRVPGFGDRPIAQPAIVVRWLLDHGWPSESA